MTLPAVRAEVLGVLVAGELGALGFRKFNPLQPRDPDGDDAGQWVKNPVAGAAEAVGEAVKAAFQPADEKTTVKAQRHAARLVANFGVNRADIEQELTRQAGLTPRRMLQLKGVGTVRGRHGYGSTHAVYFPSGTAAGTPNRISFHPDWRTEEGTFQRSQDSFYNQRIGFSAPTGADSQIGAVAAHEFGHHVADGFGIGSSAHTMEPDVARRFLGAMTQALDAPLRGDAANPAAVEAWMEQHRALLAEKVSQYGSTNFAELVAEVWQEYSTKGDDARPHIKVIGDLMRQLAEEHSL